MRRKSLKFSRAWWFSSSNDFVLAYLIVQKDCLGPESKLAQNHQSRRENRIFFGDLLQKNSSNSLMFIPNSAQPSKERTHSSHDKWDLIAEIMKGSTVKNISM